MYVLLDAYRAVPVWAFRPPALSTHPVARSCSNSFVVCCSSCFFFGFLFLRVRKNRCWKSGTFPLCDGKHVEHNKATGDNVGPLIVSGPK